MYNKEEFKEFDNIIDYIKRKDYSFVIVTKDDKTDTPTFEVAHKTYVNKMVEKINFQTDVSVRRVYLVNVEGEMISVRPDFKGNDLDMVFKGGVDIEKNINNLLKSSKYMLVVNDDNVSPIKLVEEVDVIDRILKQKDSIEHIFKIDGFGKVSMAEYDFNEKFKVELKKSREWLRIVRDYRRLLKEESKKNRG